MTPETAAPRRATPRDAEDLTRLYADGLGKPVDGARLSQRLFSVDRYFLAWVIDAPDQPGLASAAVGYLYEDLCSPIGPDGDVVHLTSITTAPSLRRRGYARAVAHAFISSAREAGCQRITLTTAPPPEARHLLTALGFVPEHAMHLDLSRPTGRPSVHPAWNPSEPCGM
ncbi:GNAT family N-acetyltransferase [Streptomyces sp. MP131-18]|uniref:GNAT family N-acetyltransferase n=1 Tax=Streptomyces sp. MP131-18 TaxID=1857892 RepID=UPI00097C5742|nr:GNAT family N-acetyltransferase [Streptomyces sp. MP131-18]ONK13199.1 Acetyltransferase (GNAT) family protein [Streptomyces sp. MP131-18]